MLKKMTNSLKGETKLFFKNLVFKIIDLMSIENIIIFLFLLTHLNDIEGIFDILLNENAFIVQAFYKNELKLEKNSIM